MRKLLIYEHSRYYIHIPVPAIPTGIYECHGLRPSWNTAHTEFITVYS